MSDAELMAAPGWCPGGALEEGVCMVWDRADKRKDVPYGLENALTRSLGPLMTDYSSVIQVAVTGSDRKLSCISPHAQCID